MTNEPREPASTEGAQLGDEDLVEVLVEDLFIEDYPSAAPEVSRAEKARRFALQPLRRRSKPVLVGLAALVAMLVAGLIVRPRKTSGFRRLMRTLGHAR